MTGAGGLLIEADRLTRFAAEIVRRACGDDGAAETVAKRLVRANLTGHDSHGVGMLPAYVTGVQDGELIPDAGAQVIQDDGPFLLIDGGRGFGQVVAEQAMQIAIDRAREQRFTLMSLRNSFHIGRVGDWGEMAAGAGFISIHYVNVLSPNPLVAPFGGREPRFVTNPYCTAIPATARHPMMVFDMATSSIAQGKVRVAHNAGQQVPEGSLIDADGLPTTDPAVMFGDPTGALTTMGLHKGFGLALLCDLLGGALGGGGAFLPDRAVPSRIVNNMLTILVNPDVFGGADGFFEDVDRYTDWVKSSAPAPGSDGVQVPGDPERQAMKTRLARGIPIDSGTWSQLAETAASVGIGPDEITAFIDGPEGA